MDKSSWSRIKGFPENEVWVHSDLIVCKVVYNNRIPVQVLESAIYTVGQTREYVAQAFELFKTYEYYDSVVCN